MPSPELPLLHSDLYSLDTLEYLGKLVKVKHSSISGTRTWEMDNMRDLLL